MKQEERDYQQRVSTQVSERLAEGIRRILVRERQYRNPDYTVCRLAEDLHTNTRYIATACRRHFGCNYTGLLNRYRVRDACRLLRSARHADLSMGDVAWLAGYTSRQTFYQAFRREMGQTPLEYRVQAGEAGKFR